MTIHEPGTLISDCLLAVVGGVLAWRLRRTVPHTNATARGWMWTLALVAGSSFAGGLSHGFGPELPPLADALLWRATLWALSFAAAAMAWSLVDEFMPSARRAWCWTILAKVGVFVAFTAMAPRFIVTIIDYGTVLVAWLIACVACARPWRAWMAAGVGASVVAALVQQVGPDLAAYFNHNDLYHVIQASALYLFYRGARLLRETARRASLC